MTGSTKILLGVVAGLVAGGAVVAVAANAAKASPSPTPSPSPSPSPTPTVTPAPAGALWMSVTTIQPGAHVRASVAGRDFAQLASSLALPTTLAGWGSLLASPQVQSAIQATTLSAWAPAGPGGAMIPGPLPADWPPDDSDAANEYHVEFVYGGAAPLLTSALPVPVLAWVAKGTGA